MCNDAVSHQQVRLRTVNALGSGATAFLALLAMVLWIGGPKEFFHIVSGFIHLFLLIAFLALILGAFLSARRIRWSLLVGALFGIAGGTAIVWHVMSRI
jgi:hypothetical protein